MCIVGQVSRLDHDCLFCRFASLCFKVYAFNVGLNNGRILLVNGVGWEGNRLWECRHFGAVDKDTCTVLANGSRVIRDDNICLTCSLLNLRYRSGKHSAVSTCNLKRSSCGHVLRADVNGTHLSGLTYLASRHVELSGCNGKFGVANYFRCLDVLSTTWCNDHCTRWGREAYEVDRFRRNSRTDKRSALEYTHLSRFGTVAQRRLCHAFSESFAIRRNGYAINAHEFVQVILRSSLYFSEGSNSGFNFIVGADHVAHCRLSHKWFGSERSYTPTATNCSKKARKFVAYIRHF